MPHAGFMCSGEVAACAAASLSNSQTNLVVVMSPFHRGQHADIVTTHHDAYLTPLGEVPIDSPILVTLIEELERAGLSVARVRQDQEHAIEIELPFLQLALGPFQLIPLMLANQSLLTAQLLARVLGEVLEERDFLTVASSDLSHFHPQERALLLDRVILECFEAFDPAGIIEACQQGTGAACGAGAIASMLWAAGGHGANRAEILKHATSGDTCGTYDSVVGYAAGVVWKAETLNGS